MKRGLVVSSLSVVVLSLSAVWVPTATAARVVVPGCSNPADSALNEYCETIPAARGGQTPNLGLPSVAATLPSRVAKQLEATKSARHALATLPAPAHRPRAQSSRPVAVSTATTSALPLWLILAMLALALALVGVAGARWRRGRRRGPPDGTPA